VTVPYAACAQLYPEDEQAQQLKTQQVVAKDKLVDKLKNARKELSLVREEMKEKIRQMVEDVDQKVSEALREDICHLSVLVDEFNLPFKPEKSEYKMKLYHHIENELGRKLCARVSTEIETNVENSQREMTERMSGLLPAEKKQVLLNALSQRESFKILYHLNLDNHCGDFQEDFRLPEAECGIQRQISAQEEKALKAGKMALEAATVTTAAAKSAEELGVETWAPYPSGCIDLYSNTIVEEGSKEPIKPKKALERRQDAATERLVGAGRKLLEVIYQNEGITNKDKAKFESQIRALIEKWSVGE